MSIEGEITRLLKDRGYTISEGLQGAVAQLLGFAEEETALIEAAMDKLSDREQREEADEEAFGEGEN